MKIGLLGFTFAHENMGCQALTYSFLGMLTEMFPNEKIDIVDFHEERSLGLVPERFPQLNIEIYRISLKKDFKGFLRKMNECDIIFDESYGDGFSDIYFTKSVIRHTLVKILAARSKARLVLTPQTYGPFKNRMLEKMAGKAIRMSAKVYSRDSISKEYAQSISHRKVVSLTDMAFGLKIDAPRSFEGKNFGINVSGLLWQGGFNGNENQFGLKTSYREYLARLIEYAHAEGYNVHLIPHVTKSFSAEREVRDSDSKACLALKEQFPYVTVAEDFEDPIRAKEYIAGMDIFIGARMHATIAAFSTGVFTVPFAYSRKFKGLYEDLHYPYFVDGCACDTDQAFQATVDIIANKEAYSKVQKKSLKIVERKLKRFEDDIRALLTSERS
ncbi:MAG: polysaccharide pyruvyl transferase family protein [Lachnospiraceae bacterium]|nr:polysaccharide pyruvyl transferase family protein [Lachnospiraceae bacterium]